MTRALLIGVLLLSSAARAEFCANELETVTFKLPGGGQLELTGKVGVFAPVTDESQLYGSRLLDAAFARDLGAARRILILGAGLGLEAIALAARSPARIDALDIDAEAVALARLNVERHGLKDRVRVARSDLFAAARGRYDLIVFNAPRPIRKDWIFAELGETKGLYVWRHKILGSPDRFDPNGRLLTRCLRAAARYLRRDGRFLLMSDENIHDYVPRTLKDEVVSVDPWCEDAREGCFAIHSLRLTRDE